MQQRAGARYLDLDSDWVLRHPVVARGADATLLVLPSRGAATGDYARTLVEAMSDGAFTARPLELLGIVPVLMLYANLPEVASGDAEHANFGSFSEVDVAFFIPVTLQSRDGKDERRGLLCPYLFVDSPIGLTAGREIYGFPKALAKIRGPSPDPSTAFDLGVTTNVLPPPNGLPRKVQSDAVIGVTHTGSDEPADADGLLDLLGNWLWPNGVKVHAPVFLGKQFRDASEPTAACFRELVRCDLELSNLHEVTRKRGLFKVHLPLKHAKPRIAEVLGLNEVIDTRVVLQARFDFKLPKATPLI